MRTTICAIIALACLPPLFVIADETSLLDSRIKAAGIKVIAYRDASQKIKAVKRIEAEIEDWKVLRVKYDNRVRELQTEIEGFIPFRLRNSVQIEYGMRVQADREETVRLSNGVTETISVLRSSLPTGMAYQDLQPNERKAREAYLKQFDGLIEGADAEPEAGREERVQIIRSALVRQGWLANNVEQLAADLKEYMEEKKIPPKKPAVAPAQINGLPRSASGAPAAIAPNPVRIVSALGKSLDCRPMTGTDIMIVASNEDPGQSWSLEPGGADSYYLVSKVDGRVLQSVRDSTKALLAPKAGLVSQRWKLVPAAEGNVCIENLEDQRVLDVATREQEHVILFKRNGQPNQQWKLVGFR